MKSIEVELNSYEKGKFVLYVTMYKCNDEIIFKVSVNINEYNYTVSTVSGNPEIKDLNFIRDIVVTYTEYLK